MFEYIADFYLWIYKKISTRCCQKQKSEELFVPDKLYTLNEVLDILNKNIR